MILKHRSAFYRLIIKWNYLILCIFETMWLKESWSPGWKGLYPVDSRKWGRSNSSVPWPEEPLQQAPEWRGPGGSAPLWQRSVPWVSMILLSTVVLAQCRLFIHWLKVSPLCRLPQQSERCSRPLSVKTFEDIPVERSSVMVSVCTIHINNRWFIHNMAAVNGVIFTSRECGWCFFSPCVCLQLLDYFLHYTGILTASQSPGFLAKAKTSYWFVQVSPGSYSYHINKDTSFIPFMQEGHTDGGMGCSPEEVKGLNQQLLTTHNFRWGLKASANTLNTISI